MNQEAATTGVARLFFALWPDDACAQSLHEIATRLCTAYGGRAMRQSTLHLTLAFLGNVDKERIPDLLAAANDIQQDAALLPATPWVLDRLSVWPHNRILWAGSEKLPSAIDALAGHLNRRLRKGGFRLPTRPFAAHIALARKMERIPPRETMIALESLLPVLHHGSFVLLRSRRSAEGAAYETLATWELCAPSRP